MRMPGTHQQQPTNQRIVAGATSAQNGASEPKETGTSIGDQHVSCGFPQAVRGEQEGSRIQRDTLEGRLVRVM